MTGFSESELIGAVQPLPFWPDDEVPAMRTFIEGVQGDGYGEHELVYRRKNGERFPAIATASVDPADGSRVILVKEVSDRTELLRRIRDATTDAETARAAFARSAEVIGEFLYSGELTTAAELDMSASGPGLATLLGSDEPTAALLAAYDGCVHPEDAAGYHEVWKFSGMLDRVGDVVQHEYRLVGADGIVRWVRDRWRVTEQDGRVFVTGAVRDISVERALERERAALVDQLEHLSIVDPLTELYNRRHLDVELRDRLANPGSLIAVAMVDVDHFKQINDEYGHGVGDDVLRTVARRLKQATRPDDVVARWGGEEFCVLLAGVEDDAQLQVLAERLRLAVCTHPISIGGPTHLTVAVSIGAARASVRQRPGEPPRPRGCRALQREGDGTQPRHHLRERAADRRGLNEDDARPDRPWERLDSNQRRQCQWVYSPSPLATRARSLDFGLYRSLTAKAAVRPPPSRRAGPGTRAGSRDASACCSRSAGCARG